MPSEKLLKINLTSRPLRRFNSMRAGSPGCFRSSDLQTEAASLRERIKHLNDMVFCQQRKFKAMIEEVRRAALFILGIPSNNLLFYLYNETGCGRERGKSFV